MAEEKWDRALQLTLPIASVGIGVLSLAITIMNLRAQFMAQKAHHEDGQYLVSVRYPHDGPSVP